MANLKSRKFIIVVLLIVVYIVSAFTGFSKQMMEVSPTILTLFGTYVVGNVGTKMVYKD